MPIDSRIPLSVQVPDIGGQVQKFADGVREDRRARTIIDLQNRDLDLRERRADTEDQKLRAQAAQARRELEALGKVEAAQDWTKDIYRAREAIQAGAPQRARSLLIGRLDRLQREGTDPSDTMELIRLFDTDPKAALQDMNSEISLAERMGLIEPGTEQKPFTDIGEARADLNAGRITQDEFTRLTADKDSGFQSDIGKRGADLDRAIQQYGADSPQARALQEALAPQAGSKPPSLSDVGGQRKEFTKLSGDFVQVRDAFNRIQASASDPSPAGDLALIFNYMKMLDPGSVVRESEFASAAASGSYGQRLQAAGQQLLKGERLAPEQREDFLERGTMLMQAQARSQRQLEGQFRDLATRSGINPSDVVIDFVGDLDFDPKPKGTPTARRTIGDRTFVEIDGEWFEETQ